jgi:hypothetical protein
MSRTVDSLAAHRRRLRLRRTIETVRTRVLPFVLVAITGLAVGIALAGAGGVAL